MTVTVLSSKYNFSKENPVKASLFSAKSMLRVPPADMVTITTCFSQNVCSWKAEPIQQPRDSEHASSSPLVEKEAQVNDYSGCERQHGSRCSTATHFKSSQVRACSLSAAAGQAHMYPTCCICGIRRCQFSCLHFNLKPGPLSTVL